jgi:hypothetical protein
MLVGLCLLLGAVTTVAVAWVLAYALVSAPMRLEAEYHREASYARVTYRTSYGLTVAEVFVWRLVDGEIPEEESDSPKKIAEISRRPLGAAATRRAAESVTRGDLFCIWQYDARGWPWPCLWYEWNRGSTAADPLGDTPGAFQIDAIQRPRARTVSNYPLALPYRPLWPALLGDTAVYSAAWAVLLFGPGAVRRGLRSRKGRCTRCGYDLRAAPAGAPCPECGHTRAGA